MIGHYLALMKREFWEHRSIWVTPVAIASVVTLGTITALAFVGDFAFNNWVTTPKASDQEVNERAQRIFEQASLHDLVSAVLYLRSQPLDEALNRYHTVFELVCGPSE